MTREIKRCEEEIRVEDIGDGYSGYEKCGGEYRQIGQTNLFQCDYCKKVKQTAQLPTQVSKVRIETW